MGFRMRMTATDFRFHKFVIISNIFDVCVCLWLKASVFSFECSPHPTLYERERDSERKKSTKTSFKIGYFRLYSNDCWMCFFLFIDFLFFVLFMCFLSIKLCMRARFSFKILLNFQWRSHNPRKRPEKRKTNNEQQNIKMLNAFAWICRASMWLILMRKIRFEIST